jgi:hypothetical protein
MEVPQGNSLCNYVKQAKMSFPFSFVCKIENRKGDQVLLGRVDTSGKGEDVENGCKRVTMVEILSTHEWK